ncbi:MAG: hypothetical protein Q8L49_18305 [Burkholderiaceae bacterium]|nr:hypothetical protein [Burkholderiaceae bacterium]
MDVLGRHIQCARVALGHALDRGGLLCGGQAERIDSFVGGAGHAAQHVVVAVGLAYRQLCRQAPDHVQHGIVHAPPARHGRAHAFDIGAEHGEGRGQLGHAGTFVLRTPVFALGAARQAHAGLRRRIGRSARIRLHQAAYLAHLVGKVILHDQAAQVLHQGHQGHDFGVVACRPQRPGHARCALGLDDGLVELTGTELVERAGPVAQAERTTAHAIQADHRDRPPHREHRAIARYLRAAHLGAVHALQQLEAQRGVAQHHLGQFFSVLALHQGQARGACRSAGQGRQRADLAHAVDQLGVGIGALVALGFEPTFEGPRQRARIAIALARLAVGGTVTDGAQGLGHRARQIPGQAQGVAAQRRQACNHAGNVGLLERRRAGQQAVHHDGQSQHVALGGAARSAQVLADLGGVGWRWQQLGIARSDFEAEHAQRAVVGQGQQERLHIAVGQAGVVGEGQAGQRLGHPACDIGGGFAFARRGSLGQRRAERTVVGHIGPAFLLADFDDRSQVRVRQARAAAGLLEPGRQCTGVGGLLPRQHQHQPLFAAQVVSAPGHAADAAAEQLAQLEATELAHGLGSSVRGGGDGHERRRQAQDQPGLRVDWSARGM